MLRGEEFWRAAQGGLKWRRLADRMLPWRRNWDGHICINPTKWVMQVQDEVHCTDDMMFIVMPSTPIQLEIIEDQVAYGGMLVVDIVADIFGRVDDDDMPPQARAAGKLTTPDAWRHWRQPEVVAGVVQALNLATVITTSWAYLVPTLRELVDYSKPVIHLPDLHMDIKGSMGDFMSNIGTVFEAARRISANRESS